MKLVTQLRVRQLGLVGTSKPNAQALFQRSCPVQLQLLAAVQECQTWLTSSSDFYEIQIFMRNILIFKYQELIQKKKLKLFCRWISSTSYQVATSSILETSAISIIASL